MHNPRVPIGQLRRIPYCIACFVPGTYGLGHASPSRPAFTFFVISRLPPPRRPFAETPSARARIRRIVSTRRRYPRSRDDRSLLARLLTVLRRLPRKRLNERRNREARERRVDSGAPFSGLLQRAVERVEDARYSRYAFRVEERRAAPLRRVARRFSFERERGEEEGFTAIIVAIEKQFWLDRARLRATEEETPIAYSVYRRNELANPQIALRLRARNRGLYARDHERRPHDSAVIHTRVGFPPPLPPSSRALRIRLIDEREPVTFALGKALRNFKALNKILRRTVNGRSALCAGEYG